jgi:glycine dehydrogenase subunit 1
MLLQRSEWYTSYTPYQPEISQGTLQAIFEFQTMVCELYGLGVANASMYDGASAAAEAVLMARRLTGRRHALVAGAVHPHYEQTIDSYVAGEESGSHEDLAEIRWGDDGRVAMKVLEQALAKSDDIACVVVQTPNFFGVVEDVKALADLAHARGALLVVANTEPVAFGVLQSPGALGADIVVGEGLGLAIPPTMGGPGVGLFGAKAEYTRQLPGRLVGETVDKDGRRGYVLTLATREQHIRREKATSNICTNQGLIALAFTIHMSLLGQRGLVEMAELNVAKTEYAKSVIGKLAGFSVAFSGPTFNEFAVRVRGGDANVTVEKLADQGIYAGVAATAPGMLPKGKGDDLMIIAVTERHSKGDIDKLASALDCVQALEINRQRRGRRSRRASSCTLRGPSSSRARPAARAPRCRRSTSRPSTPASSTAPPRAATVALPCPASPRSRSRATTRACRAGTTPSTSASIRSARAR